MASLKQQKATAQEAAAAGTRGGGLTKHFGWIEKPKQPAPNTKIGKLRKPPSACFTTKRKLLPMGTKIKKLPTAAGNAVFFVGMEGAVVG